MNKSLNNFIKRNQRRNAHLYNPVLIADYDYVVCPVSKERMSMIKSSYIEKVLGMTVDEYDKLYPGARKVSIKRKENIKQGLNDIDCKTGLTKYEISQIKSRAILTSVDENGVSGYKKKGQKTRATHLSKIDEFGRNGYSQLATKAIIKGNKTKANKGLISLNQSEFKRYKIIVTYLTEKYRKSLTAGFETGLAGVAGAWHIDHKFSILKGFQNKISPFVIGHKNNLEMIPWKKNLSKSANCSIDIVNLFQKCKYTQEKSLKEFEAVYQIIIDDIKNNIPPNAAFLIERLNESVLYR